MNSKRFAELSRLKMEFLKAHWQALKHMIDHESVGFQSEREAKEFYMFLSRVHSGARPRVRVLRAKPLPKLPKTTIEKLASVPKDFIPLTKRERAAMKRSMKEMRAGKFYEVHALMALSKYQEYKRALRGDDDAA